MKRRWLAALMITVAVLLVVAAVAWANVRVQYGGQNGLETLNPGQQDRSGYTGLGWYENLIDWQKPQGLAPNMGSNYQDSSNNLLKAFIWSGSGTIDDTRAETSYAAAICRASGSNQVQLILYDCIAWHH